MTTLERLEAWKTSGVITDAQQATLGALVRRERFSVFVELNALLYMGVLSLVGGIGWTFRDYIDDLGDATILGLLVVFTALPFAYCLKRVGPYSNDEVESPSMAFDYVLYFACLMFSSTLGFIETQFGIFQGWQTHLLIASAVFAAVAYRFDNRFALSLAVSTLAGYLGLRLALFDALGTEWLRLIAGMFGVFLLGAGYLLHRLAIKRHFLDVYLHIGANAVLLALVSGVYEPGVGLLYFAGVMAASAAAIYFGIQFRRFAFVAYGVLFGYAALSAKLIGWMPDFIVGQLYFLVTGLLVILGLVMVARRFGRDE
jgi:hypothetical protein